VLVCAQELPKASLIYRTLRTEPNTHKDQLSLTNPRDALHHYGKRQNLTSSSAAAERPREPLSQLKSCHLLHNCTSGSTKSYQSQIPVAFGIPGHVTTKHLPDTPC